MKLVRRLVSKKQSYDANPGLFASQTSALEYSTVLLAQRFQWAFSLLQPV